MPGNRWRQRVESPYALPCFVVSEDAGEIVGVAESRSVE